MVAYAVQIVEGRAEKVEADSFTIDERGNLSFFKSDDKGPFTVFAAGQWQFVKEDN